MACMDRSRSNGRLRRRRTGGLTLVETLVAVALGMIIIGICISTSIQIQRAINIAQRRELATRQLRAFYNDLENDLTNCVPFATPPSPFLATDNPLTLVHVDSGPQAGDPAPLDRFSDVLTVLTALTDPSRPDPTTGQPANVHGVVQYQLEPQVGTGVQPTLYTTQPEGGVSTSRLQRAILRRALLVPGAALETRVPLTATSPPPPFVYVDNVVSFQLEYIDSRSGTVPPGNPTGLVLQADGVDIFQTPGPPTETGFNATATGERFVVKSLLSAGGGVTINSPSLPNSPTNGTAATCADPRFLTSVPIGGQMQLTVLPGDPAVTFTVRKHFTDAVGNIGSYLADRPVLANGAATATLDATAVLLPTVVRATVIVAFGAGENAETARFTREIAVAR
jgi:type II secretory pathway component PulJ